MTVVLFHLDMAIEALRNRNPKHPLLMALEQCRAVLMRPLTEKMP